MCDEEGIHDKGKQHQSKRAKQVLGQVLDSTFELHEKMKKMDGIKIISDDLKCRIESTLF